MLESTLEYSRLLEDLAYDLVNALKKNPASREDIPCVYVAETTSDVNAQRLDLRRELQDHGFRIVPDCHLYGDSDAVTQAIDAALAESVVSVHLMGARYGTIPEGSDRSLVELQLDRARAHAAGKAGFCSIAWTPPGQPMLEERQGQLLRGLEEHPEQTEFVIGKLETLKELILSRAQPKSAAASAVTGAVDDAPQIYLLHALEDAGSPLIELQRLLVDSQVIVKLPLLDDDETICREEPHAESEIEDNRTVNSVWFDSSGLYVVAVFDDSQARIWRRDGAGPMELPHANAVYAGAFMAGGEMIVTSAGDGSPKLWRAEGVIDTTFSAWDKLKDLRQAGVAISR